MKSFAKIVAIALTAVMTTSAFGCGSADPAAESQGAGFEPQEIEIQDPGYSITSEGNLRYAFIAINPNDGQIAKDVTFTIEAYDANGSMIAGTSDSISALYPGVETADAGETELFSLSTDTPRVANLSIVAFMDSITWEPTTITNADIDGSIDIVKPRMSDAGNKELLITASVELTEGDEMKLDASKPIELRAVAVLFDESGQALCGTSPVTFTLDTDSSSYSFKETIQNVPQYTECSLYVTPTT